MEPAVFLDRDNTLIANDGDLGDPARVALMPGAPEALKALRRAGYRLVVITNQGGVARGAYGEDDVDLVHERIADLVDDATGERDVIERFYYCPYHPEGTVAEYCREHPWRKPQPGMILQAAHDLEIDLERSWLIGDQARDVIAGRRAGCRTILIASDGGSTQAEAEATPTAMAGDLAEAASIVLSERVERRGARARGRAAANGGAVAVAPPEAPEAPEASEVPDVPDAPEARTAPDARGRAGVPTGAEVRPTAGMRARTARRAEASRRAGAGGEEDAALRRSVRELTEEIRAERQRRVDFTLTRMAAGLCQMLVVLCAVMAFFYADPTNAASGFFSWMIGAVLLQLITLTLMVADLRG